MTVHIVGAGIAGLSAAFALSQRKIPVVVYDASDRSGGRCHSFYDERLGCVIDSGTHLMLGSNTALLDMLGKCRTSTPLVPVEHDFLFFNAKTKETFCVDPRRPLSFLGHIKELYPLFAESVMNTPYGQVDFRMLIKTGLKCLGKKNGQAYLAVPSLKACIVDPVENELKRRGVPFLFHKKLVRIRENMLCFADEDKIIPEKDKVILALPSENLSRLVVGAAEQPCNTIVGIHYKTDAQLPENRLFIGLTHSVGHWAFKQNGILSVTISAADDLLKKRRPETIAGTVWHDIQGALSQELRLPPYRFIASKRATLHQSKAVNALRPPANIGSDQVFLAGDSTDTGLPCTIEGAVRSGIRAAAYID